jgi:16S rRNA (guanine527-N7)-methyltransferase
MDSLQTRLKAGCDSLSLSLTEQQQSKLLDYVGLLSKWNKVFNLTSVRDPNEMIGRHIIDSLSILPYLDRDSLLDVGTGAGLPGIPVAIMRPEMPITLLDSNSKKTRFLVQAAAELGLKNITVVHGRVEQVTLPKFAMVTARAFASIENIVDLAGRHCDDAGCLILMKGTYPEQELAGNTAGFVLRDVITLNVPDCGGERHLVRLNKG